MDGYLGVGKVPVLAVENTVQFVAENGHRGRVKASSVTGNFEVEV